MSEFRLICPNCGCTYRLPADAIPAGGRQVECTACDHKWRAAPADNAVNATESPVIAAMLQAGRPVSKQADAPASAAGLQNRGSEYPPLERRVSAQVLNILRDEVAFERRARLAESAAPAPETPHETQKLPIVEQVSQTAPSAAPVTSRPVPARSVKRASGYRIGLGLPLLAATLIAGLYIAIPDRSEYTIFGYEITGLRDQIDKGRAWLYDQINGRINNG